jgi:hypothetical protein
MTAILETDPDKLAWCVQAVENAINERVASLDGQIKDEELRAVVLPTNLDSQGLVF